MFITHNYTLLSEIGLGSAWAGRTSSGGSRILSLDQKLERSEGLTCETYQLDHYTRHHRLLNESSLSQFQPLTRPKPILERSHMDQRRVLERSLLVEARVLLFTRTRPDSSVVVGAVGSSGSERLVLCKNSQRLTMALR